MRIAAVCVVLFAGASAHGQLIVGNDQSGVATIWHIDVTTGAATSLYAASTNDAKPWGMAYDGASNTLYWNSGGSLYKSAFSMSGLSPTLIGTLMFNSANINFVGLGFRNGKLVGTRNIATEAIYEIDPTSLVVTQGWVHPAAYDWGGLDVDATNGKLYGLTDTAPAPNVRGLYEIDDANQMVTFISGYPGAETDIDGLAMYNGRAYYVTDGPNTAQPFFYVYDVASGMQVGTLPSPFTGSGTFSAAAFIPSPGAMGLAGLAGLTLARRRR